MKHYVIIIALCIIAGAAKAASLKPFTSDGCSFFPDGLGIEGSDWLNCCIHHDIAYWQGGSLAEKDEADAALRQCVAELGHSDVAAIMYQGVQLGGSAYFPTGYRWGYGWPYARGYQPLNDAEKQQVKDQLTFLQTIVSQWLQKNEQSVLTHQ